MTAPDRTEPPPGCKIRPSSDRSRWWWDFFPDDCGRIGDNECDFADSEESAVMDAWAAWDRIHGKPDHSGEPTDMTRELAEALAAAVAYPTRSDWWDTARAVLDKWRATRKEQP